MNYTLTKDLKEQLQAQIILDKMINEHIEFSVMMDETPFRALLQGLLTTMTAKGLLTIKNNSFIPNENGRNYLQRFVDKFEEFCKVYDIYSNVDLTVEELCDEVFILPAYLDDVSDEKFDAYMEEREFVDLRCQILNYKNINPIQFVFMSFIQEGRFDSDEEWELDLFSTEFFDEVMDVVNNYDGINEDEVEEVLPLIIKAGIDARKRSLEELREEEKEMMNEIDDDDDYDEEEEEVYVTYVEEVEPSFVYYDDYYDYYYDPFYISPVFCDIYW